MTADLLATDQPSASNSLALIVAVIAIVPGLLGVWYSYRQRRDRQDNRTTEFGTKMAEAAFRNMEAQVARLLTMQSGYDEDREQWEQDKTELMVKIDDLSMRLSTTNQYLQQLLLTLDQNNITRPPPPLGYRSELT